MFNYLFVAWIHNVSIRHTGYTIVFKLILLPSRWKFKAFITIGSSIILFSVFSVHLNTFIKYLTQENLFPMFLGKCILLQQDKNKIYGISHPIRSTIHTCLLFVCLFLYFPYSWKDWHKLKCININNLYRLIYIIITFIGNSGYR